MSEWTRQRVDTLRTLWGAGETAAKIAEMMGHVFTRNAVVGKAHRLGLAGRPSPINRQGRRDENNPGGIRMAQQSRAAQKPGQGFAEFPTLKQGASFKALTGTAQLAARKRAAAEPLLPFTTPCTRITETDNREPVPPVALPRVDSDIARLSPIVPAAPAAHGPVTLLALRPSQCAWVIVPGDYPVIATCCGQPVSVGSGRPFCVGHRKAAKGKAASLAPGVDLSAPRARVSA